MNKIIGLTIAFSLNVFTLSAQNAGDPVLLKINGEETRLSEFNAVYNKNNSNAQSIDPKTKNEYLDLYINFKLKVHESKAIGMDTNQKFISELAGYRRQLATPYLTDQKVTDALIIEAFDRSINDVNAYHILVKVDEKATPKDTLIAFNKIQKIRKRIKNPEKDFTQIAMSESEDPSAVNNQGDLGYFSVFQMVYPFETVAYNTPKGSVSEPVRTRFGYHLIYTKDKRPARGEIRTAHIMVKVDEDTNEENNANAKKKIDELYQQLNEGADFAQLARDFSDDKGSSKSGGELPWFGTGRMIPAFENAAFSLKNNGDYSTPVRSRFGWHIIKRIELKEVPNFEESKDDLRRKVIKDGRGEMSKSSFYSKVKDAYDFKFYKKNLSELSKKLDDSYYNQTWSMREKAKGMNKPVFSIEDKMYIPEKKQISQADFAVYVERNKKFQRLPKTDSNIIIDVLFDEYLKQTLTKFEDRRLEKKYVEFGALMKEYHDGILLFDLMDKKVWSKAVKDTTGLEAYYEANKAEYMWPDRLDAVLFICSTKDIAKETYKKAKKTMKTNSFNKDSLMTEMNKESQLNLNIEALKFEKGTNSFIDGIDWDITGFTKIKDNNGKFRFAYVYGFLPSQPKKLSEARGLFISGYQDKLEQDWLNNLKEKYPVEVYREVLD